EGDVGDTGYAPEDVTVAVEPAWASYAGAVFSWWRRRASLGAVEVLAREPLRGAREPGVLDELLELGHREAVEAREHDRVAVEVARRAVDVRLAGEQRLLLALGGDAERDGRLGGRRVAEPVAVLGTQGADRKSA